MSSTTPNLGLIKPAETEVVNVADININSDKIDVSYKNMVDQAKKLAEQIKTAQETLNNMNGLIQANKNAITQLNSDWQGGREAITREIGKTTSKKIIFPKAFSSIPAVTVSSETGSVESGIMTIRDILTHLWDFAGSQ